MKQGSSSNNGDGGSARSALEVILIDRDEVSRAGSRKYLTAQGVLVAGEAEDLASGLHLIRGLRPDLVLLEVPEHPDSTIEAVRRLRGDYPQLGLILSSRDRSPDIILRCIRAGAQEFLTRPVDIRELGEAVDRLAAMGRARSVTPESRGGKVYSVFSNKGGVGVTATATNLAVTLSRETRAKTVLVDLNFQAPDAALMLDVRPKYNLRDTVGDNPLDESRLQGLLAPYDDNLSVLTGPADPDEAEKISPVHLVEVFSLLKNMFDYVVVDAGHRFDSCALEALNLSDAILVVATLDVPTVRNVARGIALLQEVGFPDSKMHVVVNRFEKRTKIGLPDVAATTGQEVRWCIPNDYRIMSAAVDTGVPAVVHAGRSKLAKSYRDLVADLVRAEASLDTDALQEV